MQRALTAYCRSGGNLLVSGAYIGSDMNDSQGNREFTQNILKYRFDSSLQVSGEHIGIQGLGRILSIPRLPNERAYPVTTPDCIRPMATAFPVMTYTGRNLPAAVAYKR